MGVQVYLVSASGQMSLPAGGRHRWDLDGGGPVDRIDLGFAVLTVPKGSARKLVDDVVTRDRHDTRCRTDSSAPIGSAVGGGCIRWPCR